MSDEDIANREYSADTDGTDSVMPSRIGGLGEMGAPLNENPLLNADSAPDTDSSSGTQSNVTGAGTNQMLDTNDPGDDNQGDGTTGTGVGGYGAGYGGLSGNPDTEGQGDAASVRPGGDGGAGAYGTSSTSD